jgi:hypothetical protein
MKTIPSQPPDRGTLASPRAAADLLGLAPSLVESLVNFGAVYSERINGRVYVSIGDLEREARGCHE